MNVFSDEIVRMIMVLCDDDHCEFVMKNVSRRWKRLAVSVFIDRPLLVCLDTDAAEHGYLSVLQ